MNRYKIFAPILILFVALDLVTKFLAAITLTLGKSVSVIPNVFQLTLVHNTGAAFGMGQRWSVPFFVLATLVALGVVGYLFCRLSLNERLSMWALILIMAGAIGNLVDRVRFGYVVDFFDAYVGKHHWPAFNVADSAITIGAILYALELIWPKKKAE